MCIPMHDVIMKSDGNAFRECADNGDRKYMCVKLAGHFLAIGDNTA